MFGHFRGDNYFEFLDNPSYIEIPSNSITFLDYNMPSSVMLEAHIFMLSLFYLGKISMGHDDIDNLDDVP